jgi:hypothetical protein
MVTLIFKRLETMFIIEQTKVKNKTGRHDIAEILLKVALNTINQIKSNQMSQTVLFIVLYYECVCIGSNLNLGLFNNEHSFQSFEFDRDNCSLFCLPKSFCTN